MEKKQTSYGSYRLKKGTIDRLRDLKVAFEAMYLESMTNDEFIEHVIASVEDGDPAVWETFCKVLDKKSSK